MPRIPFPKIPKLPGVPSLPRLPSAANVGGIGRVALGAIQGALWRALQLDDRWGIFDKNGNPLTSGSFLSAFGIGSTLSTNSVEYRKETRISDFPIEGGSFATFNKVEMPAEPTVTLCFSGSEGERTALLDYLDAACKSTDFFSVSTPEVTYVGYSIQGYSYQRRAQNGATLLIIDVSLKEIREVSAQYTTSDKGQVGDPKEPSAQPNVDSGKVQPKPPAQSTLKSLVSKFRGLL